MKSFSCISLSRPLSETSNPDHPIEIDSYKDDSTHVVRGHKGSCVHTLIEVLRCELGKHRRPSPSLGSTGLEPLKSWTPIYYAVYHNREAALLHFLRAEGSPDDVTGIGQPPLCIAVAAGHIGIVTILCEAGADVKATTKDNGETALHLAIKNGRTDIVEVLLSYGSDIEARTVHTGETPLHYAAAKTGSLAVVVALTRCGANYEALDSKGRSPAEVALQASNLHAAVAIISAAHGKRRKLVKEKELLLKHVEKAQNRFSMNNELISDIFEAGCDPDSTVLVEAIKRDDVALVEMFLDKGADPNRSTATGLHPIFAAMNCSKAQVVHTLVKHGADVTVRDAEGHTVLQAALESHSAHDKEAISGIFEALLSNGAEAKARFEDGQTLLHHVVSPGFGLAKVAQRLLEHGLKVDVRDKSGSTALHLAVQSRPCIEVLLKNGADVKAVDHRDLTPLLSALTVASKDNEPDLEPLIKVSDLRVVDSDKRTALHLAAQNGLEKSVKILLRCRAETTPLDSKNRTPLLLAVLSHQWSVVPLLVTQPGINCWDEAGATALHHIAMSIPQAPATWQDVALAAAKFCERGVSRSMRDRSGATPLIQAVKCLPEGGLPVLELLLTEKSPETRNCVNHEDHKKRSALYYAATMGKPLFVKALLMRGASYRVKEWTVGKGPLRPNTAVDKQTLKHMAEHEWLRRAAVLQRQSMSATTESLMPKVLPVQDLSELLAMGLDPNALPKSKYSSPLLWIILNQTQIPPAPPPQYIHDVLKLVLASGADANATTTRHINNASHKPSPMSLQPLSFLLEQHPTTDIDLITLFL
ncbi:ankyrin repeat-containing domain protein, partial [Massariosphaeria phaeospora]